MSRRTWAAGSALALLLPACGGDGPLPAPDPAEEAVPAAQLSVLGTVGDLPSPRRRLVVALKPDGTIVSKTGEVDYAGLEELLRAHAAEAPKTRDGSSSLYVVLRVPASVPWEAAALLLYAAADPKVKAYRVMFAAQPSDGGEPGAMGVFLPKDRCCAPPQEGSVRRMTVVTLKGDAKPPDEGAILGDLADEVRRAGSGPVELAPSPEVRMGWILRLADLAHQAGAAQVYFRGAASGLLKDVRERRPRGQRTVLQERMAALSVPLAGCRVTVGDFVVRSGAGDAPPPRPARVRGAFAGVAPSERREQWGVPPAPAAESANADAGDVYLPEPEEEIEETEAVHSPRLKDGEVERAEPVIEEPRTWGPPTPGFPRVSRRGAIDMGIDWLVAHQDPDGGWKARGWNEWCDGKAVENPAGVEGDARHDTTVTGLALLAVLGSGRSHLSKDPYGRCVQRALVHLRSLQAADGRVDPKAAPLAHAIATLAWVESAGRSGSASMSDATQRALDLLARWARNPATAGPTAGPDGSLAAWTAFALAAARRVGDDEAARGRRRPFSVADDVQDAARVWLSLAATPVGVPSSAPALEAARLFARFLGGEDPDAGEAGTTAEVLLREHVPGRGWTDGADFSHALFAGLLARQTGPDVARGTRAAVLDAVIARQRIDGNACGFEGSYDPRDPFGVEGGRVYATATATLALLSDDLYEPRRAGK